MQKRAAGIFWNDWTRWNRCAPGQRHSHMEPEQRDCGETTQPQRQTVAPPNPLHANLQPTTTLRLRLRRDSVSSARQPSASTAVTL